MLGNRSGSYIYLWINYAVYEELTNKDVEKTRSIYKACLQRIPHEKFTFAKVWLLFAHFEVRQMDIKAGDVTRHNLLSTFGCRSIH
jgi:hypothetical protein